MPDIIRGWKAIAEKLGVSVSKAQELEANEGLPVRRDRQVFILYEELENWVKSRPAK